MPPESRKLIYDMLMAAQRVVDKTAGVGAAAFDVDDDRADVVHWNLMIVGEALSQLAARDRETADGISNRRKIIALRNQIVHGYAVIRRSITWHVAQEHVPLLIEELKQLLSDPTPPRSR